MDRLPNVIPNLDRSRNIQELDRSSYPIMKLQYRADVLLLHDTLPLKSICLYYEILISFSSHTLLKSNISLFINT
jgi:hypothetical protein